MKRFWKESGSPSKGGHNVMSLRLWVLFAVVLWIFLPPPRYGFAACAPWEGGPCIDITPPSGGGGERPERPERDSERTGGGGCATMPTHQDSSGGSGYESTAPLPAGTPHAQHPNVVWDGNGQLHPAEGYAWVYPNDPNDFTVQFLPEGTPHSRYPNVVWAGNGKVYPAEGYTWAYPNDPNDFSVQFLPQGTPHPRYPNVVWAGNGQLRPAQGYVWASDNPGDFAVVPVVVVANWSDNWKSTDQDLVYSTLRGITSLDLKEWMAANVMFGRYPDDGTSALSASGSTLRFKDRFFSAGTSLAQRENLIAFEGGKVFYDKMKDMPLKSGGTLGSWFRTYYYRHTAMIEMMKETRHRDEEFSTTDLYDEYSRFAHVFRAKALQLHKPEGQREQREWDEVMREFQMHLDQVLPGR